jgi:hypothetical protein
MKLRLAKTEALAKVGWYARLILRMRNVLRRGPYVLLPIIRQKTFEQLCACI